MEGYQMHAGLHVMLNPVAGAGRAGRLEEAIIAGLKARNIGPVVLIRSTSTKSLLGAASGVTADGARHIVAVGGDGTINEVINGILSIPKPSPKIVLSVINAGTGQGFAKGIGLPVSFEEQLDVIAAGRTCPVDAGVLEFTERIGNGSTASMRYFVNECEIGIGAEIVRRTTPKLKQLGGTLSFGIASLGLLPTHYSCKLHICGEDREVNGEFLGVTIANGPFAGGSMQLAPAAKLDDGQLDMVCFRKTSFARKVCTFSQVYSGKHIGSVGVESFQSSWLKVESDGPCTLAVDGELVGETPCAISTVRAAIHVTVPYNAYSQ